MIKLSKQRLYESIGADLDVLAQESSSFEQFVAKIKSDPDYMELDVNDTQVVSFLQTIYDGVVDVKEARGFTIAEAVKSPIRLEVVLMITELAEGYGVKIPTHTESGVKKRWNTITKMAEYAVRGIDPSNRKSFIKDVMRIKKAINNDEIVI